MPKIYVLDSTVFLEGYFSAFADKPCITTYNVVEEIKEGKASIELDRAMKTNLEILQPSYKSVNSVIELRGKTKDKLSTADISVVALALDFKEKNKEVVVISDDYAIQNLCKFLKIEYLPISQKGIEEKFKWTKKCTACDKKTDADVCEVCGSRTHFVPKKVE